MGIVLERGGRLAACAALVLFAASCRPTAKEDGRSGENVVPPAEPVTDCAPALIEECRAVRAKIVALERSRDEALSAEDGAQAARLSLAINLETERLGLYERDVATPEALASLESKYAQLGALLDRELTLKDVDPTPDNSQPVPAVPSIIYHKLELEAVQKVFADFGDLYITESISQEFELPMPWAGYWYPLAGTELFEGSDAPLVKFDRIMARLGRSTLAADKEREYRNFAAEDSWEGRCFAWATASVVSAEPRMQMVIEGETFSVEDRKALLTKVHELYPTKRYGIRYNGDATTDGTLQDIRPEAFHQIFMAVLVGQRRPFLVDDDPGIEVWSKPVYRMRWAIRRDPDVADAYLVDAMPFMVSHRTSETNLPTTVRDRTAPAYKYRLFVDPVAVRDGKFRVIAGEWLDQSRNSHPDSIAVADAGGPIGSSNLEVNKGLDIVRRILELPPP